MKNQIFLLMVITVISHSYTTANEIASSPSDDGKLDAQAITKMLNTPKAFNTGECSGKVIDAQSGEPVEGAVVLYIWSIEESFIESSSRMIFSNKTVTDKNGKYLIPDQPIKYESQAFSRPKLEDVYIYKNGYLWYHVDLDINNKANIFISSLPQVVNKYQKKNNLVRLERWNNKLSHMEHMHIFTFFNEPEELLKPELKEEMTKAQEEEGIFTNEFNKLKNSLYENRSLYTNGKISKEEFGSRLEKNLNFPNSDILSWTFFDLTNLNQTDAVDKLIKASEYHLYRSSFRQVISCLAKELDREELEDADIDNIQQRREIIQDLEQWRQRNKGKSKAESYADLLLTSKTEKSRYFAINQLRMEPNNPQIVPYLAKALNEENVSDSLVSLILNMLGDLKNTSAIPVVKEKSYHRDIYIRKEAVIALHKLGDDSGIPIMIESLNSQFINNQSVANSALMAITGKNFIDERSLRLLSDEKRKKAVEDWKKWWDENKNSIKADKVINFNKVLNGEAAAKAQRLSMIKKMEQENPELPVFDDPNKSPERTLERLKAAVLAGDDEKAVSYFAEPVKGTYREILKNFGGNRGNFVQGMGIIYFSNRLGNTLNYEMITEQDDGTFSFPIKFSQDLSGNWLIFEL